MPLKVSHTRFLSRENSGVIELVNRTCDIAGCLAASLVVMTWAPILSSVYQDWALLVLVFVFTNAFTFEKAELYRSWRGRPYSDQFGRLFLAWGLSGLIIFIIWSTLSLSEVLLGQWLLLWLALTLVFIVLLRIALHVTVRKYRSRGLNNKFVLIYGAGSLGKSIANQVRLSPESGFKILGFIDDNPQLKNSEVTSIPVVGTLADLCLKLQEFQIDELWIALPLGATQRAAEVLEIAEERMVSVRLFPDLYGLTLLNHSVSELLGFPIIDLNVNRMQGVNQFIKEAEDKLLSFFFLLLSAPLIALISLAIRADSSGPVLFKQRRNGWDGKPFTIYKFRTMCLHAEPTNQLTQASKNDERFTKIGRWLRRTSLDELPQLFNVLQGTMSLVGPRPHALEHDSFYRKQIEGYIRRSRVKPGITGWAQINDLRGEVEDIEDMVRRVKHDLYYIEHWSVLFDLRIILATILKIFFSRKAW